MDVSVDDGTSLAVSALRPARGITMLQLLRKPARKAKDEAALDALFQQHDLTTRLPEDY